MSLRDGARSVPSKQPLVALGGYSPALQHTRPSGRCQGHAIGNFIPDFVCIERKLIIELDGSQHLEQEVYDKERTRYLELQGYKVIRFGNNQVMNDVEGVMKEILFVLETNE